MEEIVRYLVGSAVAIAICIATITALCVALGSDNYVERK